MTLLKKQVLEIKNKWKNIILDCPSGLPEEEYKKELDTFQEMNIPIYPKPENIFRAFHYFDPEKCKIVIIGQDPYHGPNQATGLCFGTECQDKLPPSLRNIEKKMMEELDRPIQDYTLEKWARQGILLLNTALTVRHKSPASHAKWWRNFTNYIVNYLNEKQNNIIFVAWGAHAHNILDNIDTNKHSLIVSSHPSPLSYSRAYKSYPSFKETKLFTRLIELLNDSIEF